MKIREIVPLLLSEVEIIKRVGTTLEILHFGYIYDAQVIRFGNLEIDMISSDYKAYPLDPDDMYETEFYYIPHIQLFVK